MSGKVKRIIILVILTSLVLVIGFQVYSLNSERLDLKRSLSDVNNRVSFLEIENISLENDLNFFSDTENLAKAFKSQFNYKRPGEKLIIVIPDESQ